MPEDDDFYGIKADQLNELIAGGRSWSLEIALLCGGTVLGYIPSAFEAVSKYTKSQSLDAWEIGFLVVFIVLSVLSVLKLIEHQKTKKKIDVLRAKIESGQKMKVGSGQT